MEENQNQKGLSDSMSMTIAEATKVYKVSRQAISERLRKAEDKTAIYNSTTKRFTQYGEVWLDRIYHSRVSDDNDLETFKSLDNQIKELQEQIATLQGKLVSKDEEIQAITATITTKGNEIDKLKSEKASLQEEVDKINKQNTDLWERIAELKSDKEFLQETIERLTVPRVASNATQDEQNQKAALPDMSFGQRLGFLFRGNKKR